MSHNRGSEAQVAVNTTGSLHPRQITMPHAMDVLYNTAYIIQPRNKRVLQILAKDADDRILDGTSSVDEFGINIVDTALAVAAQA
jgi:hypothetical protein